MRTLLRVLVIGFAAVIALLAAAAIIAVNNARSIAASAAGLVNDQLVIARLLDEVQREQEVLNTAFYRLSRTPDLVDRERVLADLDQTDNEIRQMVAGSSAAGRMKRHGAGWNAERRARFFEGSAPASAEPGKSRCIPRAICLRSMSR